MNEKSKRTTEMLLQQYRDALLDDILPWWQRHSIDEEHGAYFSFLDRQGERTSGHKFTWAIARQAWIFSYLCNTIEQREEWLDVARRGVTFLDQNAIRGDNSVFFRFDRLGKPLATIQDATSRCLVVMALVEYAKASGEAQFAERAIQLFESVAPMLGCATDTPLLGYPLAGYEFHIHADDMIRLSTVWTLHNASCQDQTQQDRWKNELAESCRSIIARHWHPELDAQLENVAYDGTPLLDIPEGRMIHPGHAMESAWMIMESGRMLGNQEFIDAAVAITNSSMRRGWDEQNGGLRYLMSIDNRAMTFPPNSDVRLWWVHAEAIYATLLAWLLTGNEESAAWHAKVHEYTFTHFPDKEHGEWFGWLNPDGTPIVTDKANGWKGCFHIPRTLARAVAELTMDLDRKRIGR